MKLVVGADDYGLTPLVSRGILRAHREGIVTSTSVLAVGRALDVAGRWLEDAPLLGVGVHLAAVGEDPPVLTAREVPTLVDPFGRFPLTWRGFARRVLGGRVDPEDLSREFSAQIERVRVFRSEVTHLDTHQHIHLLPIVSGRVLELCRRFGIGALRVTRGGWRRASGPLVSTLASALARRARKAGVAFTDVTAGFVEAGRFTARTIRTALLNMAHSKANSGELIAHPGEPGDRARERFAWGYDWEGELAALLDPAVRRTCDELGFRLSTYADLRTRSGIDRCETGGRHGS